MARSQQRLRYKFGVDSDNMCAWQYKEGSLVPPEQQNALAISRGTTPPALPPATNGAMTFSSISPTNVSRTAGQVQNLTATGTGFAGDIKLMIDGVEQPTIFVSPTTLTCQLVPSRYSAGVKLVKLRQVNAVPSALTQNLTITA
jgi:hypothetical protein